MADKESKKKSFVIGFIPKGWKKGEGLRVVGATPTAMGIISQGRLPFSCEAKGICGDDIAYCHFVQDDTDKVNRWLKWWYG